MTAFPQAIQDTAPAVGLDTALDELYAAFNRGWLTGMVFRRARHNRFPAPTGETRTSPQVYLGKGQYYNCLPNDSYSHTLFFRTDGPERSGADKSLRRGGKITAALSERPLSLVFWGNLKRIKPGYGGDSIYTERIKEEFMRRLYALPCVKSINEAEDTSFERVFEGYDMPDDKKQYDKFPFASLRIDFTVTYRMGC